ncbi:interleukin-23 receptor [Fundulus heteroclitus]|uniref:interleukin-23 receptor n=1 Tax=Fundulus heteroclitus TaxID=8078 RepID=UPI00165AE291|nr:interleukin-23 receptor [Fundulus heteroclitus]XP_021176704.2 interleukin-23 receptor [Fundulus heteroclitus]
MNLLLASRRCIIMLLCFSIIGWPLLPADCIDIIPLGYVTAEPATPVLMGSNLTVFCHLFKCEQRSTLYLELNKQEVKSSKRENCTTTVFYLPRVWMPLSKVVCMMQSEQVSRLKVVSGLDLRAGLPPDKPANISCETARSSDLVNCSLQRGQETYLHTRYNISVLRENESIFGLIQDGEKISIPRAILDENTKYTLIATAYNHFGATQSDPFIFSLEDIVIPETPHIVRMEFMNESTSATLYWNTSESSMRLRPQVRLSANNDTWEQREVAELSKGLIQVENLRPLTEYEFQIKTCASLSRQTPTSTPSFKTSLRSLCSKWSPSVRRMSPGKGPSQELHVWRTLGEQARNGLRTVTVFWKPPPLDSYSGELLNYSILLDNGHEENCSAASSQCSVQAPVESQTLSVRAVTSYGTSPPASVDLRHTGFSESFLGKLTLAADAGSVHVSWSSTAGKDLLYFVIEWESMPAGRLHWTKVLKELKETTITGLMAGVKYNLSLYAVTTRGVSAPASRLIYSREQKPLSAPTLHVLIREARRILVRWDELPLSQQRGFITKYTFYWQTLDSSSTKLSVTVSGSDQRQLWLDCPEGALTLQLSASNSAGEGPRGGKPISPPADPAVHLVIVIVFILAMFVTIVANLMCWGCVRKRIKQKCIAWGPEWLVDNLPKPGHSNAIRLLEDDRSEPLFSSVYSDPPLSPILVVSQEERDEVYPAIHVEESQAGSEQATTETMSILVEYAGYKPQIAPLVPLEEEANDAEEEQTDGRENPGEDRCLVGSEGLLGGLLCRMDVDCSDASPRVTLGSIGDLLLPGTAKTSFLNGVCLQEMSGKEEDVVNVVSSLDLQQDVKKTLDSDDTSSLFSPSTLLNSGYFPQVASLGTVPLDTQR